MPFKTSQSVFVEKLETVLIFFDFLTIHELTFDSESQNHSHVSNSLHMFRQPVFYHNFLKPYETEEK